MLDWDERYMVEKRLVVSGTKAWSQTLGNVDVVDNGDGTVMLNAGTHGYKVGSQVYIDGTTNYDGLHTLTAVAAATITFVATYVAEKPGGSETVRIVLFPGNPFQLMEVRLHLNAIPTTSENIAITLDSAAGADFDVVVKVKDMAGNSIADWDWAPGKSTELKYLATESLIFTWANSNSKTYGLEIRYKELM